MEEILKYLFILLNKRGIITENELDLLLGSIIPNKTTPYVTARILKRICDDIKTK